LAQRPVVALAGAGAEVDVVVAEQVDVLVMGVVDAGHLRLAEVDPEPLERGEDHGDVLGVPVVGGVGAEPAGFELALCEFGVAGSDSSAVAVCEAAA
jgi:hypothetical protein